MQKKMLGAVYNNYNPRSVPHLFNAVPVGLGQVEAAGGCSWLVTHHTEFGHRREALSSSRHTVLARVEQPPVVPCWCYNDKVDRLFVSSTEGVHCGSKLNHVRVSKGKKRNLSADLWWHHGLFPLQTLWHLQWRYPAGPSQCPWCHDAPTQRGQ